MRTLHADLTTAQQAASATPYLRVELISRDQATVLTYTTTDSPNRVIRIRAAEGMEGGSIGALQISDGTTISIGAIIRLSNHDSHFTSKDLRGYKVNIGWGFNTTSGNKYSEGEPYWVVVQQERSEGGLSTVDLVCFSAWTYLDIQKIKVNLTSAPFVADGVKIRHILMQVMTDNPDNVQQDDGGVFTDESDDATDKGADDVKPFPNTPAVNDAFYIGDANVFDRVTNEITTTIALGGAALTATWEYYNGSSWASLANVTDGTSGYQAAIGVWLLAFDLPTNWATVAVNSVTKYWIRLRVTAASGTPSTSPLLGRIGINRHWGIEVGTTDSLENTLTPFYKTELDRSNGQVVKDMLQYLHSSLIMEKLGFKLSQYTDAPGSADYSYDIDSGHTFFSSGRERALVIPNRVTVVNVGPGATAHDAIGTEDNSGSQTAIGILDEINVQTDTVDNTDAANRANRLQDLYNQETFQGQLEAPMNCGQEVWDWLSIVDDRNSVTYTGRLGALVRLYEPSMGTYRIHLQLGIQAMSPVVAPTSAQEILDLVTFGLAAPDLTQIMSRRRTRDNVIPYLEEQIWQGQRPRPRSAVPDIGNMSASSNIIFTRNAYNVIGWVAATIKFGDGTSYVIDAATSTLANDYQNWLYWELGSTSLVTTYIYSDIVSDKTRVVIAAIKRGASSAENPTIIPFLGTGTTITSQDIGIKSVDTAQVVDLAVTGAKIDDTTIAAGKIVNNTITANQLATITGATIQTAASGNRVVLNASGISTYGTGQTFVFRDAGSTIRARLMIDSSNDLELALTDLVPLANTQNLGSSSTHWQTLYVDGITGGTSLLVTGTLIVATMDNATSPIVIGDDINPDVDISLDMGTAAARWNVLYVQDINIENDIIPETDDTSILGDSSHVWADIYAEHARINVIEAVLGSVNFNDDINPNINNTFDVGTPTYYWAKVYADTYYGKTTTIASFDKEDDLALIKQVGSKRIRVQRTDILGVQRETDEDVVDEDTLPPALIETEPSTGEKFINTGASTGFLIGVSQRLAQKVEELEARLAAVGG